jgi:hypothetical protein
MPIHAALIVAAILAAMSVTVAVPIANADPTPGDLCGAHGRMPSPDGALVCDMQSGRWLSASPAAATEGQPCPGAVGALTTNGQSGELNLVMCYQTPNGPLWQHWRH